MMRWQILITLMLFIPIVYGLNSIPLCEDTIQIHTNCTMITPYVSCVSYNYTIYNTTNITGGGTLGNIVEFGILNIINSSSYYFNFTQGAGNYLIELCDGTTRMVEVTNEGDNTVLGMIILMPLILAIIFIFVAYTFSNEHVVLKIFFMLLGLVSVFTAWQYGMIVMVDFFGQTQLTDAMAVTTQLYSYVFYAILTYFAIYIVSIVSSNIIEKNKHKYEY